MEPPAVLIEAFRSAVKSNDPAALKSIEFNELDFMRTAFWVGGDTDFTTELAKIFKHVVKNKSMDMVIALYEKCPILGFGFRGIREAFILHRRMDDVSALAPFVVHKPSGGKLDLRYFQFNASIMSVDLIKKCERSGTEFSDVYPVMKSIMKALLKLYRYATKNQARIKRLTRALIYLKHIGGCDPRDYRKLLLSAVHSSHQPLIDALVIFMQRDDETFLKNNVAPEKLWHVKNRALRRFIAKEAQVGGKIDNWLCQPPHGLMVQRGLRECCKQ